MTSPYDPHRPQQPPQQPDAYAPTQFGTPIPDIPRDSSPATPPPAAPLPSWVPTAQDGPHPAQPPQTPVPQMPMPQTSTPQVPAPGSYGQAGYPAPGYGPAAGYPPAGQPATAAAYGPPQQPPGGYPGAPGFPPPAPKSGNGKAFALIGSLVAVVAVVAGVLIWAPWDSDSAETDVVAEQTFPLSNSYQLGLIVPAGWTATASGDDDFNVIANLTGDTRSVEGVRDAIADMIDGRAAPDVHSIGFGVDSCDSDLSGLSIGDWDWDNELQGETDEPFRATLTDATTRLDETSCLVISAVDVRFGSESVDNTAEQAMRALISTDQVRATKPV